MRTSRRAFSLSKTICVPKTYDEEMQDGKGQRIWAYPTGHRPFKVAPTSPPHAPPIWKMWVTKRMTLKWIFFRFVGEKWEMSTREPQRLICDKKKSSCNLIFNLILSSWLYFRGREAEERSEITCQCCSNPWGWIWSKHIGNAVQFDNQHVKKNEFLIKG